MVDFICLGAQKAGTTGLYDYLSIHPEVFLPQKKEIHFFSREKNYSKGNDWYNAHFDGCGKNQICGDISPDYMFFNYVPKRIFKTIGKNVKLIIMLRNPIHRAYSQYNMLKSRNVFVKKTFLEEISLEKIETESPEFISWSKPRYCISKSIYAPQIKRFINSFPKENIHYIIFEEFIGVNRKDVLKELCDFLDISFLEPKYVINSNKTVLFNNRKIYKAIIYLNPLFKKLNILFGDKHYYKVKNYILKFLGKSPVFLDSKFQASLMNKFFIEDVKKIEKIIGKNLKIWYQ